MNQPGAARRSVCGTSNVKPEGICVGVLAVATHLATLLRGWSDPQRFLSLPDSREYLAIAANLRAGHGFSQAMQAPYAPDLLRTPVYPALLALISGPSGPDVRWAAVANSVIGLLTYLAACLWVRRYLGPWPAIAAGLLLATDLTSLTYHHLVLTETAFAALLLCAAWFLAAERTMTMRSAMAAGVALGVGGLCRPIAVLLGPALLPAFAAGRPTQAWRPILSRYLACNVICGALLALWVLRNLIAFGDAQLTSVGGMNLYLHRAAYVLAYREGVDVEVVRARLEREFEVDTRGLSSAEKTRWLESRGRRVILEHPLVYATVHLQGIARMAAPEHDEVFSLLGVNPSSALAHSLVAFGWLHLFVLYGCVCVGIVRTQQLSIARPLVVTVLTMTVYVAVIGGPEMYPRFRAPLMPLLAAVAALAFMDQRAAAS